MKGQKQQRVNLERLRAANSLDKSEEKLRASLAQEATAPPRTRRQIGIALGSLALGMLVFGWWQCSNRNPSISCGWQSQVPVEKDVLSADIRYREPSPDFN